MAYSNEEKMEARRLYVEEGWQPPRISEHFGGQPVPATIYNWAEKGAPNGKPWDELRKEYQAEQYENLSPAGFATELMDVMQDALQERDLDGLSKANAVFRDLVDPKYRYGITMEVLTRFLEHIRDERPEAFADADLADLARSFRKQEKSRLGL
jgi:hypothetical protein